MISTRRHILLASCSTALRTLDTLAATVTDWEQSATNKWTWKTSLSYSDVFWSCRTFVRLLKFIRIFDMKLMRFTLVNILLIISLNIFTTFSIYSWWYGGVRQWFVLNCRDFITVRLGTTQLLVQHISLLGYASLPDFVWHLGTVVEGCCNAVHGQPPVRFAYHCCCSSVGSRPHCCVQVCCVHKL